MAEKVKRALIPYFGEKLPKKAHKRALDRLKKGGKLFLLHIVDEAPTRSLRYRTGQMGEESEIVKTFRENLKKAQEKSAEKYADRIKKKAAKQGVSIEPIYVTGNPAEEVLKAIDEHSIELVLIERLREKISEVFLGDEIDHICKNAPCEVITVGD
ncbi:hypothetical protein AKJ39_00060 [candidate division MSBL1 archaeon SCGC-AAA259J03]|uniref:UspA domain-containing protein n=1 Tax=candidate division MSBL1 archaeon SCGC-AAA259J03 TaxID=1698269 RepID=A0A656YXI7_9EURY|nr:hypothetical protein AKJ39_00060 [candidate division MSBL1 archaeon SCGC-AAA259J03]